MIMVRKEIESLKATESRASAMLEDARAEAKAMVERAEVEGKGLARSTVDSTRSELAEDRKAQEAGFEDEAREVLARGEAISKGIRSSVKRRTEKATKSVIDILLEG